MSADLDLPMFEMICIFWLSILMVKNTEALSEKKALWTCSIPLL